MLKLSHCSEEEFVQVLGIPPEHLFPQGFLPEWLKDVLLSEEPAELPLTPMLARASTTRLLSPCLPLISLYSRRLEAILQAKRPGLEQTRISREWVAEQFAPSLLSKLVFLSQRALALEVNVQSVLGLLEGTTPEERYLHFLKKMDQRSERTAFFQKYPVLARNIQRACTYWLQACEEFLERLFADFREIERAFEIGPGDRLKAVSPGRGDSHCRGRSVILVSFESGKKIVYKPRSLAIDQHFQDLITWINAHGLTPKLRRLKVLDRGTYGWMEFVEHSLAASQEEVNSFYSRQGALLGIMHLLAATDMHFENIVAAGGDPVLIDLETLFHGEFSAPVLRDATEACHRKIGRSVMAVGLLPMPVLSAERESYDASGIGGKGGQSTPYKILSLQNQGKDSLHISHAHAQVKDLHNRPQNKESIPALQLVEGFTRVYRILRDNNDALLAEESPLSAFAADSSRIVIRPTRVYGTLAMDATHPDFLRDDLDRARHWNLLWNDVRARSELEKFLDSEMRQIELGDIPYFAIRPESTEAQGADGTKIPDAVSEPGQTAVRRRLSQLSDSSMEEQLWFIRASLGCVDGYARKPKQGSERTTDSLLDAARDAGNEVLRSLIYVGQMASFLNISCVSGEHETQNLKYAIRPADNGLYEGVGGVALFLAYLARESGDAVFEKAAEALLNHVLKTDESGSPVLLSAFSGVCSRLYLFTHLGRLWQRTDLLDRAERLLTELPGPIEGDRSFDIISGTSGALLSLLALSRLRPTSKAKDMAVRCGEHLLQVHEQKRSWESAPFHRGFSHGASGISFALARLAQETGEVRYRKGALDAASYERALLAQGNWTDRHADRGQHQCSWCHGAAGIALARLGLSEIGEKAAIATDLQEALQETARSYRLASQCLCHGTLGNLEPLLLASRMGISSKEGSRAMEGAAARLQDEIRSSGWRSGLPSQTLSNGLFTGLSGIGYGFLRLRNPDTVPSVLTLAGPL